LAGTVAVAQARAGEPDTFRLLVEQHSRALFRLAYRMTGNEQDAEDVVQETLLRAHRHMGSFEERSSMATWLHRIATNCALDLLRQRQRHDKGRESEDPEGHPIVERLAGHEPAQDRLFFNVQVKKRNESAMARLTPTERTAFVLRHFEGRGLDEIAPALGLRVGAVKNTIFRAVAKLRRELEGLA